MEVWTIANQKGGIGKTTTAAALAQIAAHEGRRTLAIDLDAQANLTFTLAGKAADKGAYAFINGAPLEGCKQSCGKCLDLLPAGRALATLTSGQGSALRLQKQIKGQCAGYDLIIIDTPPQIGELQFMALQAATSLIIPLQAEIYSLQGLYQILETARHIQKTNGELKIKGIVFTAYNGRASISAQLRDLIIVKAAGQGVPYLGSVSKGIAIAEAQAQQVNICDYAPKARPVMDYMAIYEQAKGDMNAYSALLRHQTDREREFIAKNCYTAEKDEGSAEEVKAVLVSKATEEDFRNAKHILMKNPEKYAAILAQNDRELCEAIEADTTGEGFIYQMFCAEWSGNEAETIAKCRLTAEQIEEISALSAGLKKAAEDMQ